LTSLSLYYARVNKFASLHDWLTVELNRVYNVPRAIAAELVESGQILPLLDALDEAVTGNRDACLKSLNEFRHSDGLTPFAVSSRIEDYERLSGALELSGAIMIQPLAETEIRSYLIDTDAPSGLLDGFDRDPDLRELLNTPLWMNVVLHAFRDSPDALLLGNLASADLRRHDPFRYVDHMLSRPRATDELPRLDSTDKNRHAGRERTYTRTQAQHWLCWLASSMIRLNQSPFYLEGLEEDSLSSVQNKGLRRNSNRLFVGLAAGLVVGFISGLALWMVVGRVFGLVFGLFGGLVFGLYFGFSGRKGVKSSR
jgi:hypothetical protein